jgi:hypothetical protein
MHIATTIVAIFERTLFETPKFFVSGLFVPLFLKSKRSININTMAIKYIIGSVITSSIYKKAHLPCRTTGGDIEKLLVSFIISVF